MDHRSVTLYAPDGKKLFEISELALLDSAGKAVRVIPTEPYTPSPVCFAPDHTLWVYGEPYSTSAEDTFLAFRHYSREGRLLGSFVRRAELPAWEGAGLDQAVAPFTGLWALRASRDRIGARLHLGGRKWAWVELDFSGKLTGTWTYTNGETESVLPAAFTADGSLYGEVWINGHPSGVAVFDRSTGGWRRSTTLQKGRLLGADGDDLVFQRGDQIGRVRTMSGAS